MRKCEVAQHEGHVAVIGVLLRRLDGDHLTEVLDGPCEIAPFQSRPAQITQRRGELRVLGIQQVPLDVGQLGPIGLGALVVAAQVGDGRQAVDGFRGLRMSLAGQGDAHSGFSEVVALVAALGIAAHQRELSEGIDRRGT